MKIESIKYHIDSGISIFCEKSEKSEAKQLTPERLRYVVVNYDISLIKDPLKMISHNNIKKKKKNFKSPLYPFFAFIPKKKLRFFLPYITSNSQSLYFQKS
ncbi:MAG: hypothetical protein ACXAB8_06000 [Promethearchaeota archaeon]